MVDFNDIKDAYFVNKTGAPIIMKVKYDRRGTLVAPHSTEILPEQKIGAVFTLPDIASHQAVVVADVDNSIIGIWYVHKSTWHATHRQMRLVSKSKLEI